MKKENFELVVETIDFPVHYYNLQQTIRDAKGMMVCDIRGWGKIQFMGKSEERQDAIGEVLAHLLNKSKDSWETKNRAPETTTMVNNITEVL